MRFLSIFTSPEQDTPPSDEEVARMGELIEEWSKKGKLLATEGCLPSALGARIRRAGGEYTVKDGPFTEAKEVVGGFAVLAAESKEEAIELAKAFMDVAGDGQCEVRQLYEQPAFVAE